MSSDLPALRRDPLGFAVDRYRRHGTLFPVRLGATPAVMIAGREANDLAWLDASDWSYHDAAAVFREQFSDRYLTQLDGPPHLAKRRRLAPAFRARALQQRSGDVVDAVVSAVDEAVGHRDGIVDLRVWCKQLIVRMAGRALVRVELTGADERAVSRFEHDLLAGGGMSRAERDAWFARPAYRAVRRRVLDRFGPIVDAALADPSGDDLLSAVIREHPDHLDRDELVGDLVLLLQAGSESTAHLLLWALFELDRHPAWIERVRAAVAGWDHDVAEPPADLLAVVLETERRRPPLPFAFRVAARPLAFAGTTIPAGTPVWHAQTLLHHLAEVYPHPDAWDPSRFLDADGAVIQPAFGVHGTFGGGRHVCIGQPLARLEALVVLATVLSRVEPVWQSPISGAGRLDGAYTPVERRLPVRFDRRR